MGSKIGVLKIAAKRVGLSFEDYMAQIEAGLKWCNCCRFWKETDKFGNDRTRGDGLDAKCLDCRHVKVRVDTKGRASAFKGRQHTDEAKRKMSEVRKGKPSPKKGIPRTEAERKAIKESVMKTQKYGAEHFNYIDGRSEELMLERKRNPYRDWRTAVYERDGYTCQRCNDSSGGNLNAHHIKSFTKYPELRFEVSNGVTLCETCHDVTHYGKPRRDRR